MGSRDQSGIQNLEPQCTSLLQAAGKGCRASFENFYGLTCGYVLGIVEMIHHQPGDAETVLQTVYAEAWRQSAHFDAGKLSAADWMGVIARTVALDSVCQRSVPAWAATLGRREDQI